jgi:hypothetical protein
VCDFAWEFYLSLAFAACDFAREQVGVDKVVPFLLPGRPGEYLVQVLGREEGVLA